MDCFQGCFGFLGGGKPANGPATSSSGPPQTEVRPPKPDAPPAFPTLNLGPASRLKKPGKVSSKVRLRETKEADPVADLGMAPGTKIPSMFDEKLFLLLMEKLLGQSKYLQNNPRGGVIPEEERAAKIVMDTLRPYSTEKGGPLKMEVFYLYFFGRGIVFCFRCLCGFSLSRWRTSSWYFYL